MWLRLQADTDVFDGTRDEAVGEAGEGAGGVVLGVREFGGVEGLGGGVEGFEVAAGEVEAGELDRDLGVGEREGWGGEKGRGKGVLEGGAKRGK